MPLFFAISGATFAGSMLAKKDGQYLRYPTVVSLIKEKSKKLLIPYIKPLDSLIKSPKQLTIVQWAEVEENINKLYNNFTLRLKEQFPSFTENDLQVCCLIKLRISVSNMAEILNISPASVSKRKQRIKEQIIKELGDNFDKSQLIDIWIWEY